MGPDDFLAMTPIELVADALGILRMGRNMPPDADFIASLFQRLDALHQLLTSTADPSLLTPVQKLTKDLKEASRTLGTIEARFLVDAYYAMQENRIRSKHQVRTLAEPKKKAANGEDAEEGEGEEEQAEFVPEPHDVLEWLFVQEETLEKQIRGTLDIYSLSDRSGVWARSIKGIGPVIAAGLLANLDIEQAPTVGHFWSFAGLNPDATWGKGQKRPWNASLKRLCFLIGESFVKVSNRPDDVYGKLYKQRKEWETERNSRLLYAEQAKAALENKKFGTDTDAFKWYSKGMLPPARIHLRAQRRAVKLFLAHLHEVMYWRKYNALPPFPFVFEFGGPQHVHLLELPNADLIDGLPEARAIAHKHRFGPKR
jgi:Transposase IS116/IS110/IS902 family